MKKLIILPLLLVLAACHHTQPDTGLARAPVIPELPAVLSKKADSLPQITDNTMGGLVVDGTNTDIKYNDISHQLNAVIDVYNCVRESINNKKEIKCL